MYKDLIKNMVVQDLRLRYKNTVLGFFWSLLYPLLLLLVLYFVFSQFLKHEIENYTLFLLIGIILWRFFATGTIRTLRCIVDNMEIIKRVYFPRIILVLSVSLSALVTCIFELAVYLLLYFIIFNNVTPAFLWIFPLVIFEFFLVFGAGLLLATLYSSYRDTLPVWQIFLQAGFFLTPVFYPLSKVPEKIVHLYLMNPMARIMVISRNSMLKGSNPSVPGLLALLVVISLVFIAGFIVFKKREPNFARSLK